MTKVICYCGKSLDDPTHKETHQDKFLTQKEFLKLDLTKVAQARLRKSPEDPWLYMISRRVGDTFHMIGLYQPL